MKLIPCIPLTWIRYTKEGVMIHAHEIVNRSMISFSFNPRFVLSCAERREETVQLRPKPIKDVLPDPQEVMVLPVQLVDGSVHLIVDEDDLMRSKITEAQMQVR